MATYRSHHEIHLHDDILLVRDQVRRDTFDGAEAPTKIKITSTSGTIDQFTEEITYHTSHVWMNVSGLVGTITDNDVLFGHSGRVKHGDTKVSYHYDALSGVYLNHRIVAIELCTPALSGVYDVNGAYSKQLAGQPIFIEFALSVDHNG